MTVPGVYSPGQLQAHVEKVIASDGVDDSRAVEDFAAMLPRHSASLTICHNEHLGYYMTVADAVNAEDHGYRDWVSPQEMQKAIDTNEAWYVQWYPDTPVGFCILAASTLPALLTALGALRALEGE